MHAWDHLLSNMPAQIRLSIPPQLPLHLLCDGTDMQGNAAAARPVFLPEAATFKQICCAL